jgi:hypothetical protein
MQREIKFSLLFQHDSTGNIVEKKWTLDELLDGVKENTMPPTWHLIVARQYTGLQDKNDKEIYEGDIVADGTINYIVVSYEGAWRLKRNVKGDTWWKSLYRYVADHKVEIAGNICENSELLKEGK